MARQNKREAILDAAVKVFSYYGYDGGTLDKIGEQAGVSVALVVKYYKSKEELVRLCLQRRLRYQHAEGLDLTLPVPAFLEQVFGRVRQNRDEWRYILSLMLTPNRMALTSESTSDFLALYTGYFAQHAAELRDPAAAFALSYITLDMLVGYVLGGNEENYRRAQKCLLASFLKEG